ncbi:MAG: Uma2 family endonuclease [Acidobacteriaceae bacterium]|jgi:Uma2 family endonuclease
MSFARNEIELPVRLRFERPMTDDELVRFCAENDVLRVEREPNGEILVMTPAGSKTSKMNQRIGRILDEWTERDGRGVCFDSSGGFTLPDGSMRNPDAAWIGRARWDSLTDAQQSSFAPVCPEFVIELRSPSDKLPPAQAKMEQWIANGAEVAWLIDPIEKAVTIYRPGDQPERLVHPTSVQGTGPIAGFELVMSRIWE